MFMNRFSVATLALAVNLMVFGAFFCTHANAKTYHTYPNNNLQVFNSHTPAPTFNSTQITRTPLTQLQAYGTGVTTVYETPTLPVDNPLTHNNSAVTYDFISSYDYQITPAMRSFAEPLINPTSEMLVKRLSSQKKVVNQIMLSVAPTQYYIVDYYKERKVMGGSYLTNFFGRCKPNITYYTAIPFNKAGRTNQPKLAMRTNIPLFYACTNAYNQLNAYASVVQELQGEWYKDQEQLDKTENATRHYAKFLEIAELEFIQIERAFQMMSDYQKQSYVYQIN